MNTKFLNLLVGTTQQGNGTQLSGCEAEIDAITITPLLRLPA